MRLCGGLDIKLTKTPLIYNVSRFNLGVLGTLFGGLRPPKPPRGDGTAYKSNSTTALSEGVHLLCSRNKLTLRHKADSTFIVPKF